jgi:L-fucose isomerase-like protein
VDWNNNYGDDRDKCVAQHCSNYPRGFIAKPVEISTLSVLGQSLGEDICFGGIRGNAAAGPMTYCRVSTDDRRGVVRAYLGEGEITDDPFEMAGGIAVCRIPRLQHLMKHICKHGFEHHGALARTHCAAAIREAFETYLGWELYFHE